MSISGALNRLVDPDGVGKSRGLGNASYEALRVKLIRDVEHSLALAHDACCLTAVHRGRREQAQTRVTMLFIVPTEKSLTESATILNAPEAVRELRPILQGAKLTF